MYCIDSYKDKQLEIQAVKDDIEDVEQEIELLYKHLEKDKPKEVGGMVYSDMPKGNKDFTPLDRTVDRIYVKTNKLNSLREYLNHLENSQKKTIKHVSNLNGAISKVAIGKLQGKTLEQIARENSYSISHVKKVSARLSKL